MANENAAKKRILVIGDGELNNVLYSINGGLEKYQLVGLPCVPGSSEKIVENELSRGNYSAVLVDELFLEFVPKMKQEGKKYGVIRWSDYYDDETRKTMTENKTVRFGFETPDNIERELEKIFG